MEQQRDLKLRHPAYQMTQEAAVEKQRKGLGWSQAPVLIVILGDGRRQWATVQGAHTFGRGQSHLTDGLANTAMMMHLAAASLGLGSQHNTIHIEEPFKRVLGVPPTADVQSDHADRLSRCPAKPGVRRPLEDMVHRETYDMTKYMSNEEALRYLYSLREKTVPVYAIPTSAAAGNAGP